MGRQPRRRRLRAPTARPSAPPVARARRRLPSLRARLSRALRRNKNRPALVFVAATVLAAAMLVAMLPSRWPRRMLVTAYCPCTECCGPNARGITASGRPVSVNGGKFVAADRDIPFGTLLTIPGYNNGRPTAVLDRGGAIKGDRLDVFFPTHEEAKRWGARRLEVGRVESR